MAVGPIFGRAALLRRHADIMQNCKGSFSTVAPESTEDRNRRKESVKIGTDCLLGATWRSVIADGDDVKKARSAISGDRRSGHGLLGLANGGLLLLGGRQLRESANCECDSGSSASTRRSSVATGSFSSWESSSDVEEEEDETAVLFSDVCRSDDGGRTWTVIRERSEWCPRDDHGLCGSPDGNILMVLGGWSAEGDPLNDVWLSTDGGKRFECRVEHAPWQPRADFACVFLPSYNRVLVYGGYSGGCRARGDLWLSDDLGVTWTELTDRLPPNVGNRWGAKLMILDDKDEVLLCLGYDPQAPCRSELSFTSDDGGMTWCKREDIESWASKCPQLALARNPNSTPAMVLLTRTWRRASPGLRSDPELLNRTIGGSARVVASGPARLSMISGPNASEVFESVPDKSSVEAQKALLELIADRLPQGVDFQNIFRLHVAEALLGSELSGTD
ncbi:hypothetical protein FOL47_006602 [Perkinsus chesapeaki]|uniref:Uncharacterized protein n=1 Tax=Perkinsus chesapeaki TaxID=330153 RepID=A0A7J6LRA9_PERCH|nr:hypothetical protein FOL47_006602 [Perkinsus chesapeaki]